MASTTTTIENAQNSDISVGGSKIRQKDTSESNENENKESNNTVKKSLRKVVLVVSTLHIILGVLGMICALVAIGMNVWGIYYGVGFWGGGLIVVTGVVGLIATTLCIERLFVNLILTVCNSLTLIFALVLCIIAGVALAADVKDGHLELGSIIHGLVLFITTLEILTSLLGCSISGYFTYHDRLSLHDYIKDLRRGPQQQIDLDEIKDEEGGQAPLPREPSFSQLHQSIRRYKAHYQYVGSRRKILVDRPKTPPKKVASPPATSRNDSQELEEETLLTNTAVRRSIDAAPKDRSREPTRNNVTSADVHLPSKNDQAMVDSKESTDHSENTSMMVVEDAELFGHDISGIPHINMDSKNA